MNCTKRPTILLYVWSYKDGEVRYSFPRSRQSRRDLPRDNPLDSVESLGMMKKGEKWDMGRVRTKTELVLEQTQQGSSYEVLVSTEGVEEWKRIEWEKGENK